MEAGDLYIRESQLRVNDVYLMISFLDAAMHVPEITTVVYLGMDTLGEQAGEHHFQDYEDYKNGAGQAQTAVIAATGAGLVNFFDLEGAAQLLSYCARSKKAS